MRSYYIVRVALSAPHYKTLSFGGIVATHLKGKKALEGIKEAALRMVKEAPIPKGINPEYKITKVKKLPSDFIIDAE